MDVAILVLDLLPLEVEPGRKVEAVIEENGGESKRVLSLSILRSSFASQDLQEYYY